MIILLALLLFVLGLLLNALILKWLSKKFKTKNATYENALKVSFFEWLATILIGVIVSAILTGLGGSIITWTLSFIAFNLLCKRFYSTKLKQNVLIYLIVKLTVAAIFLAVILPLRAFIAEPFYVSGSAMSPTLNNKDYVIFKIFDKNYERGDIILHKESTDGLDIFLKRIVGLPGEKIQIKDNVVYIYSDTSPSGQILNEPYLLDNTKTFSPDENIIILTDNQYYVLGDNREHSKDSRVHGPIDGNLIIGKYWFMGMRN